MSNSPIFTNHTLAKMNQWQLSEKDVLDVLNKGEIEPASCGGKWNSLRKYSGYEIGINYDKKDDGTVVIISVWKRIRR
jgi:hypothetical protein